MKRILVPLILTVVVVVAAVSYVGGRPAPVGSARTVVMSMNEYTFNQTNPTLAFEPGERVRFLIRNDETSPVRHNFRIVGVTVPCGSELEPGQTREVTVTMPRSGEFAYTCCTHPGMGGKLVIEGP